MYDSFLLNGSSHHRNLHSFPTRRSSDLDAVAGLDQRGFVLLADDIHAEFDAFIADENRRTGNQLADLVLIAGDRKSTRLNSSHANISYAVFCLKKKKN